MLTHMSVKLPCSSVMGHEPTGTFLEKFVPFFDVLFFVFLAIFLEAVDWPGVICCWA